MPSQATQSISTSGASSAIGLAVPDFSLPSTGGEFTLSAYRGKTIALYFYPKDSTPGCTTQAQQFRDLYAQFVSAGVMVIGVSRDSLKSHINFKANLGLPFELISDSESTLCRLFDVIKVKMMYGKKVLGIERSVFLIDPKGVLRQEWRGIKADGGATTVLAAAQGL